MAAALGLHLELEVRETGSFAVETELAVATGRENLCVQAFERLNPADAFTFRIASQIPLCGGLGSSAAAIVAGLMAADHMFELDVDLLALGSEIEGHPDNVAAALNGGFVVSADGYATRFDPPTGLEAIAVVPASAVHTRAARAALPAEVPLGEAVFNIAHGALLTLGLAKGDWDLVARGL
jgi:homoserine kinase